MPERYLVTFQPLGGAVEVLPGTLLADAAAEAAITLDMPCGGEGLCGKCRVIVRQGAGEPGLEERRVFSAEELRRGLRLACQSAVIGPTVVEVPAGSLLATFHQILSDTQASTADVTDPVVIKRFVELTPPSRQDDAADLVRLGRAIGPEWGRFPTCQVDLELVRRLPALLRQSGFRGTAVLADGRLLDFEPGNTVAQQFAVAVDVGTTSLVAMLVDLRTGRELAVAARLNPQTRFGDDVISRIVHAQTGPSGLDELRRAVCDAIDAMIGELTHRAGVPRERVYAVALAGNTTMQHLLCGIDPRFLGEVPFVPATGSGLAIDAADLGLRVHSRATAYVAPTIGGFVGGDTVAGMAATDLARHAMPTLLVDIGTNGELVLAAGGRLWAAATAAGPAFEGARIRDGMRASVGAIEKVTFDGRLHLQVIGGAAPLGICGSALIDLAAELLRHQVISPEGRMCGPESGPACLPAELRRRLVRHEGEPAFAVCDEAESGAGRPVLITQRDVRQLQLASGAIRAGTVILLKRAGLRPADLDAVLIAGGFGNYIRRRNAQRIGLLPPEIPRERIRFQGNTSLAGARLLALSRRARDEAESLARRTEHFDLATDHGFHWAFADAMIFPSEEPFSSAAP